MKFSLAFTLALAPATTFAATIVKRISPLTAGLPSGWSYSGCYADTVSARELNLASYSDDAAQTAQTCISFCSSIGYPVAGTEFGAECFCGLTLPAQAASNGCNMACTGDSAQTCGGPDHLSVYASGSSVTVNPGPSGWHSLGCYTDSVDARTLTYGASVPGGSSTLTVTRCTTTCKSLNYRYAGVEYAGECFCSNTLENGGTASTSSCNMPCKGNFTEFCGGSNNLNVYEINSTPTCPPTIHTGGKISNGGFESGSAAPWTFTAKDAQGTAVNGKSFEGCWAWDIQPYAATRGIRSAVLTSEKKVRPDNKYRLTFFLGRRSSAAVAGEAQVAVFIGDKLWKKVDVCSEALCDRSGAGGSVWRKHSKDDIEIGPGEKKALSFVVTWTGTTEANGNDDVLIDGILLKEKAND